MMMHTASHLSKLQSTYSHEEYTEWKNEARVTKTSKKITEVTAFGALKLDFTR